MAETLSDSSSSVGDSSTPSETTSNTESTSNLGVDDRKGEPVQGKISRPYPSTSFRLEDHPVDERRNLRVRYETLPSDHV